MGRSKKGWIACGQSIDLNGSEPIVKTAIGSSMMHKVRQCMFMWGRFVGCMVRLAIVGSARVCHERFGKSWDRGDRARLESVAEKNMSKLSGLKASSEAVRSQMDEILKNLQVLSNVRERSHDSDNGTHNVHDDAEDSRLTRSHNRFSKVEFPKFHGTDVEELPWNDYVRSISARFVSRLIEDVMGALKALNQTGTLDEYYDEFDLLLNKVSIPEEYAISLFLEGLKPEIRCHVKLFKPTTLRDSYSLARLQNQAIVTMEKTKNNTTNSSIKPTNFVSKTNYTSCSFNNSNKLPLLPAPIKANPINSFKPAGNKRLSGKDFEDKRAKGECFWCTEKFTLGHKCSNNKQLFLFEIMEEKECEEKSSYVMEKEAVVDPHISLCAIMGAMGIPHNFLNAKMAKKLNCQLQTVKDMPVTIADGNKLPCMYVCKYFQWVMQGNSIKEDLLVIPLSNYDIVLGIQWLQTLNDIIWNFKKLTMKFKVNNHTYELKGTGAVGVSLCPMQKMSKLLCNTDSIVQAQLFSLQATKGQQFQHETKIDDVQADLEDTLDTNLLS
ncbi:hypothetical protein E3N88_41395 [Mikania micrantha]|uniref:Ty3 transposon capsid-like protein domain-containing protein n=1 Tax=Mikania micrantha TaxID=192012 RepID=A0A5N6LSL0_9ASTR|nr:hypothetical protein E3N88_41395 [Mikania micrantha]